MDPIYINIASMVVIGVIGFLLVRYIKSVDKKLEMLNIDVQALNVNVGIMKAEQETVNGDVNETKNRLESFIDEMRAILSRMKDEYDRKIDKVLDKVQNNNDNIIRLEVKVERIEKTQDTCPALKKASEI